MTLQVSLPSGIWSEPMSVPASLADLAAHPAVEWVRKPLYPETPNQPWFGRSENAALSEVTTEGLALMNGVAWHNAGCAGQGARVGIIDTGFGGYEALLGGELPASIRTHFHAFGSDGHDPRTCPRRPPDRVLSTGPV